MSFFLLVLLPVLSLTNSTMSSNFGTSFYLSFIRQVAYPSEPRIIIGTNSTSNISYAVKSLKSTLSIGKVNSSSAVTLAVPISWLTNDCSYSERNKGLHVSASAPIYVISTLYRTEGTTAAHQVLPAHHDELRLNLHEYITVSCHSSEEPPWSVVLLIGNEDNTSVSLTTPVTVEIPADPQDPESSTFQLQPGDTHTVTLNRLQTLLFGHDGSIANDMSGTRVLSSKPLTVISGNECAAIAGGPTYCVPLATQILPVVTWGVEFVLSPMFGRYSGHYYKVVTSHNQTSVRLTCSHTMYQPTILSNVGSFVELATTSTDYCFLESDHPVLVAQLSFNYETDGEGDSCMIVLPSIDQFSYQHWFRAPEGNPSNTDYATSYINVIVVTSEDFSSHYAVFDGRSFKYSKSWPIIRRRNGTVVGYTFHTSASKGDHLLTVNDLDTNTSIMGIVYGFTKGSAYGFPTGITYKIRNLISLKFSQFNYTVSENECGINIDVIRIGSAEISFKVKVLVENVTSSSTAHATSEMDFLLEKEEVKFAVGERIRSLSLLVYDDEWVETKEELSIRLLPDGDLLLDSNSSFISIIDNDYVHVGITSAIMTTSPRHSVEVCVSIIAGVLQPGITLAITVTVAVKQQTEDKPYSSSIDIKFTQNFITHCPQLQLFTPINLNNATETTNNLILTARLNASDDVQVTLDPSTTIVGGPSTSHWTPFMLQTVTPQPESTAFGTTVVKSTAPGTMVVNPTVETSSPVILIAVSIVTVLVCIAAAIISVSVIVGYRYQREKALLGFKYLK